MNELSKIKGIGPKTEKCFNNIDIYNCYDLISYYPRDYEFFDAPSKIIDLKTGNIYSVKATIISSVSVIKRGKVLIASCLIDDGTARIYAYWFNVPYIIKKLKKGSEYIFRGKISFARNKKIIVQPKTYSVNEYNSIIGKLNPIYNLTKGLSNSKVKSSIEDVFSSLNIVSEYLPNELLNKRKLCDLLYAYKHIHFPDSFDNMLVARKRLVYDEFFLFSLAMSISKKYINNFNDRLNNVDIKLLNDIVKKLPFKLTKSQVNAIKEICSDFKNNVRMNRLLEGDVGSGKTLVAFFTSYLVAKNGYQVAFMAPTEVLAKQHFENLVKFDFAIPYSDIKIKIDDKIVIALLTGNTSKNERKNVLNSLKNGDIDILIGTHALFSKDVIYNNLQYIIIDEQHRFGVAQRKQLEDKGENVHVLSMSATPIPRTLSMMYYANMDISRLYEKPKHRLAIKNYIISANDREKCYEFIKKQINLGHQAYIVCAAIDNSSEDNIGSFNEYQNVTEYSAKLNKYFNNKIKIGVLHGKMDQKSKDEVFDLFKSNITKILVSTTVIEVGVDVPNATCLIVEDASSFGLAELHQLRGRVGRSNVQSYTFFVDTKKTKESKERLDILLNSNDGFYIAEEDLKLRGPGDIFGIKQSGEMNFKLGDIYTDFNIFKQASEDAKLYENENIKNNIELNKKLENYLKIGYVI